MEAIIIEELFDRGFKTGINEAYAMALDGIPTDRIGGILIAQLDRLDWEYIEISLKMMNEK